MKSSSNMNSHAENDWFTEHRGFSRCHVSSFSFSLFHRVELVEKSVYFSCLSIYDHFNTSYVHLESLKIISWLRPGGRESAHITVLQKQKEKNNIRIFLMYSYIYVISYFFYTRTYVCVCMYILYIKCWRSHWSVLSRHYLMPSHANHVNFIHVICQTYARTRIMFNLTFNSKDMISLCTSARLFVLQYLQICEVWVKLMEILGK